MENIFTSSQQLNEVKLIPSQNIHQCNIGEYSQSFKPVIYSSFQTSNWFYIIIGSLAPVPDGEQVTNNLHGVGCRGEGRTGCGLIGFHNLFHYAASLTGLCLAGSDSSR